MNWRWKMSVPSSLWTLVLAAVIVRLGYVLLYDQFPPFQGDDLGYERAALDLINGRGFVQPGLDRAGQPVTEPLVAFGPVYPLFLAAIYAVFGHSLTAVRVIQALLSAAMVFLVFQAAFMVFGKQVAVIAGGLTTVHPALITCTGMVITETLFAFLLMLSVWITLEAMTRQTWYAWAGAGIAFGLAALLREETLAIVALVVGWIGWSRPGAFVWRRLALLAVALVLTVGAWTARNYLVLHELVPVSANGGKTIWISAAGWSEWHFDDPTYKALTQGLTDLQRDHVLRREGIKKIVADPGHYLRLCLERIPQFWVGSHTTYLTGFTRSFGEYYRQGAVEKVLVKAVLLAANFGLLMLAVWGTWVSLSQDRRRRDLILICLCPVIAIAAVHFFLFATSRYQIPVLPFMFIFSAVGLIQAQKLLCSGESPHLQDGRWPRFGAG
jgi:4-amino-4-deoxy-L-arabinose transferase-like glycosyltransferase